LWDVKRFDSVTISIASPEEIRAWSKGEVKKPETINYRTHKPERGGLFCEKIFGPYKDWECFCGKYRSIRYKGVVCERCGVEITHSRVRRERMGHIELASPVAHIWYTKGTPSYIALLLDISPRDLERVLYFNSYIVIDPGNLPLMKKQLLTENQYRELRERYGSFFDAKMGAEAIKLLLSELNLENMVKELRGMLKDKGILKKKNLIKRLEVAQMFLNSPSKPEWMILEVLPVIPPDLRPMVQLDGGRFATSDLNDLYRRVINRNNRLKRLMKLGAPDIIIKNEKRMLQEAVNSLIDNGRRGRPVTGPGKRPLKSLTDMLKGKQGRFRQNLLGKRVDYSGRSVIVVGPKLKLHECGLPKQMALELFKPFIMNKLVSKKLAHNIKSAKKMLERNLPEVWDVLEEVISEHPVLLNRAPTLHRLGIQAFLPRLIEGKAIQIHPLVCTAFNADFDGDQMAVHVPLLLEAISEARVLMLSSQNIFSPAAGYPICVPTQDMIIGMYYLTMEREPEEVVEVEILDKKGKLLKDAKYRLGMHIISPKLGEDIYGKTAEVVLYRKGEYIDERLLQKFEAMNKKKVIVLKQKIFSSPEEAIRAYEAIPSTIDLHTKIWVYIKDKFYDTTVGRLIFNRILPEGVPYYNIKIEKSHLSRIIEEVYNNSNYLETARVLDELKEIGFHYATLSGLSISPSDLLTPKEKVNIIKKAEEKSREINERYLAGKLTREEKRQSDIDIWTKVGDEVADDMLNSYKTADEKGEFNSVYVMAISGARGNFTQIRQLSGMRGLMSNPHGDIIDFPIISNFREGLGITEYFISTYGARKGLVDTALRTADSGYLTRRLVDVTQEVIVKEEDCGTKDGVEAVPLREKRQANQVNVDEIIVPLRKRIAGRVAAVDVIHPKTEEVIIKGGELISEELAKEVERAQTILPADENLIGKINAEVLLNQRGGVILRADRVITPLVLKRLDEEGIKEVKVRPRVILRSPITCKTEHGICRKCYGLDLSTKMLVNIGEAVGVIGAQSIGEPGTQLTMRTFHIGGIALAQRVVIKAKMEGEVSFKDLVWEHKTDRSKQPIGIETIGDEFEKDLKKMVLKGSITITAADGKKEKYLIPTGAILKVNEGSTVAVGDILAEYNPNLVISECAGHVFTKDIYEQDGIVVSDRGQVIVERADGKGKEFYKIPQGAQLKVREGDFIQGGDIIAEILSEQKVAIAESDGKVEFFDIKVKNNKVISDTGIVFISSLNPKERVQAVYDVPTGVKDKKGDIDIKNLGVQLKVKSGNEIKYGDEILAIYSEIDGVVNMPGKNQILVQKAVQKEYKLSPDIALNIDEENSKVTIISKMSGIVKILSSAKAGSGGKAAVSEKRVIVNQEKVYKIPESVKLFIEDTKLPDGETVASGQEVTGPIPLKNVLGGIVHIEEVVDPITEEKYRVVKVKSVGKVNLRTKGSLKDKLLNKIAYKDIVLKETGEVLLKAGEKITEDIVNKIVVSAPDSGVVDFSDIITCVVGKDSLLGYRLAEDLKKGKSLIAHANDLIDEKLLKLIEKEFSGQLLKVFNREVVVKRIIDFDTVSNLNPDTLEGTVLENSILDNDSGEIIFEKGTVLTKRMVKKILKILAAEPLKYGEVVAAKLFTFTLPEGATLKVKSGETVKPGTELYHPTQFEDIWVINSVAEYKIPRGAKVIVEDGAEIEEGDDIIEPLPPIKSEIDGKVNYVLKYDKDTGKDVITQIVVYAGEEYIIPSGLPLVVRKGQVIAEGDPLTEEISYIDIVKTDKEIIIKKLEKLERKYKLTSQMEVNVSAGDEVRVGKKLAVLRNTDYLVTEDIVLNEKNVFTTRFKPILQENFMIKRNGREFVVFGKMPLTHSGLKSKLKDRVAHDTLFNKDTGEIYCEPGTIIDSKLASKIEAYSPVLNKDELFVTYPDISILFSTGEIFFKKKLPGHWQITYAHDEKGVVKLIKRMTQTGRSMTTVGKVIVQDGESHQVMDGAELKVIDQYIDLHSKSLLAKVEKNVVEHTLFNTETGEILIESGKIATGIVLRKLRKQFDKLNRYTIRIVSPVKKGTILAKWGVASRKTIDIIQGLPRVDELFEIRKPKSEALIVESDGEVKFKGSNILIESADGEVRQYKTQLGFSKLIVSDGEVVRAGDAITEESISPKHLAQVAGIKAVQRYLIDEVQQVYFGQGVKIDDKHIEIIIRQMLRKVLITEPGDTNFLPDQIVHIIEFQKKNAEMVAQGKTPAKGRRILQGITKAALTTDSFLSAASFQETTRVLTRAAIEGKKDELRGLKENLIIGKLIPAGTGAEDFQTYIVRPVKMLGERESYSNEMDEKVEGLEKLFIKED